MAGCTSCSGCNPYSAATKKPELEKLEKGERSSNPRYPLVFVGRQAIYTENGIQMIVTVLEDQCDDQCDCFVLKPALILKDPKEEYAVGKSFEVSQAAGASLWKLQGLI